MTLRDRTPRALATVATGPGPCWLRLGLAGLAVVHLGALIHHPSDTTWLRPAAYFTQATSPFPPAAVYAIKYRLEVWACGRYGP